MRCARSPAELERSHPAAAASLREGLEETLTLTRLIESMIECVRRTSRNVKRWQSGDKALRWTAAGMLEAEQQFRRVIGYRDLAKLAIAIKRDLASNAPSPSTEKAARSFAMRKQQPASTSAHHPRPL